MAPAPLDLILPCLNESAALPHVLSQVPADIRVIVVDNGSDDGSPEVAIAHGATVVHESQRGYGAACHRGLLAATAKLVGFCDADGSFNLQEDLPRLRQLVDTGGADLALGRRKAAPRIWPWHAWLANQALSIPLSAITRTRLHDLGPMRVARREPLLRLPITDRRSGYPLETVIQAARAGWCIRELPVTYYPRIGRSKVTGTFRGTTQAIADMTRVFVSQ
ncbi:MAG: glycosyltransferase family 2 protein [Actinomycetota bacterium]